MLIYICDWFHLTQKACKVHDLNLTDHSGTALSLTDPNGFHGVGQPMMPMQPGLHPGQQGARSPGAADPGFPRMMAPGNAGSPRGIYPMGQYPQLQQMPGQFMKLNQQVSLHCLCYSFSSWLKQRQLLGDGDCMLLNLKYLTVRSFNS